MRFLRSMRVLVSPQLVNWSTIKELMSGENMSEIPGINASIGSTTADQLVNNQGALVRREHG